MYYYLQKDGVYISGIFWIGMVLQEGREEAIKNARMDTDDYHKWQVVLYKPDSKGDNEILYSIVKSEADKIPVS